MGKIKKQPWLDLRLRPQSTSFEVIQYTVISKSITTSLFTFTSVSTRVAKNTELASADNTFYNLGSKVPVSQITSTMYTDTHSVL